jgi:hypothetical protein
LSFHSKVEHSKPDRKKVGKMLSEAAMATATPDLRAGSVDARWAPPNGS